ncbi:MAG TPA: glycosyltransferase family 2 protein [Segeticoccus sp.]|uniref:glycosyltransferase family 2 protein n=1 Tax=Segeticoccus sp. TaxID=2706531 RepID=UPI002D7F561A|nr:glycosyltransferase family 2 protein [Segeticoccus sp.]HET8599495.1 glycosyltransferase family 2 protein [Segeticoccus sp.]
MDAHSPATPLVTVVVPALDEEQAIGGCLASVLAQSEHRLEVLVVDGGSRDRTRQAVTGMAATDPRVRLLHNPARGIPQALNVGLAAARAPWLVRVDAHSTVPPDYVARALGHLQTGRWGGVGGRKDAVAGTATGRAIAAALGSRLGVGGSTYHHGTTAQVVDHVPFGAYPTELLRSLGGWDEAIPANEDFELDHRVRLSGRELLFDPDLRIAWHCRESVGDLFAQYRRYGRGKAAVARKHPGSLRPRHLVPPVLVGYLGVAALSALRRPVALLAVLPYAGVLALGATVTGRGLTGSGRARLTAALLAMHTGWGLGVWEGLAAQFHDREARP